MLGGPRERSGFPPPLGGFTPPLCGLFLLRRSHAGLAVLAMLLTAGLMWAAEGSTLKVRVFYEGSGKVSATHPILVGVFDTPFPAPAGSSIRAPAGSSVRLQSHLLKTNDDTVTFENVSWSPVYVMAMYSEKGRTVVRGGRYASDLTAVSVRRGRADPRTARRALWPQPRAPVRS